MPDTTPPKEDLLTTKQVADFVSDGLLRFDELVPDEINQAVVEELDRGEWRKRPEPAGAPLDQVWPNSPGLGELMRLPKVRGIIHSLIGPGAKYDHHAIHIVKGGSTYGQRWHADGIIDVRAHFDIQLFYFPHDTPREMGGTMFLPGSHFRRISNTDIARHQNFRNQMPVVCKAGTLLVGHHGLWHCAQPNHTDKTRYMFKIRLNARDKQYLRWNTDDMNEPGVLNSMGKNHGWYGVDDRLEYVNRIKLWRLLVNDPKWDMGYWLSRIENAPEEKLPETA